MILTLVVLASVSNLSHGNNCQALLFHLRNYSIDGNAVKFVYLYNFRLGAENEDTLDTLHLKNVLQTETEYYAGGDKPTTTYAVCTVESRSNGPSRKENLSLTEKLLSPFKEILLIPYIGYNRYWL